MCHFLQHLCDLQLRHRVESVVAFSDNYVESCQNVSMTCKLHLDIIHLGNKYIDFADGVQYIIYHIIVASGPEEEIHRDQAVRPTVCSNCQNDQGVSMSSRGTGNQEFVLQYIYIYLFVGFMK